MFNKWNVYSYLKRVNGKATIEELYNQFPDESIILEGVNEYNAMASENDYFYDAAAI